MRNINGGSMYGKGIIISLLIANISFASKSNFIDYFDSLEKRLLIKQDHLLDISQHIRLKKLSRWSSRNAEATYSPMSNTISLKDNYLMKEGRGLRVRKYNEFEIIGLNSFFMRSVTIFHELHHGDFEVYIKKNKSLPIYSLLSKDLPNWFRKNIRGVNTRTATHELFGYTAGEVVQILQDRIQSLLMNHGIYFDRKRCFKRSGLEKVAARLGLDKKLEYKNIFGDLNLKASYIPKTIFINGKDIDMENLPLEMKERLVDYFIDTYQLPKTSKDLVKMLNNSNLYRGKLDNCYSWL